jgi:hypothetical protein
VVNLSCNDFRSPELSLIVVCLSLPPFHFYLCSGPTLVISSRLVRLSAQGIYQRHSAGATSVHSHGGVQFLEASLNSTMGCGLWNGQQ